MPRLKRLAKNALLFRSLRWATALQNSPVKFSKSNARDLAKGVYLPDADAYLTGTSPRELVLLEDLGSVRRAREELGAKFEVVDGTWQASFDGLRFRLVNKEDAWLLSEIFLDGTYDVALEPPPRLAIDIGMNCGIASLYLARKYGCEIYSFELCRPTFETAEANMKLNPELARHVHRNCFGLGERNEALEIDYPEEHTVVASMYDMGYENSTRKLPVEVRRASEVLRPILEGAGRGTVFAKVDCEGAEFPILRDLEAEGLLGRLDAIAMEWHSAVGDPKELAAILERSGFQVAMVDWVDGVGFIRATRGYAI